ncbi:MAG: hypothetical protein IJW01_07125 [Paludibacteraceae bacterium]|nr:hypothetical protein [Paludibacteraceae bacterium]
MFFQLRIIRKKQYILSMIVSDYFEGENSFLHSHCKGFRQATKKVGRILRPTSLKLLSTI